MVEESIKLIQISLFIFESFFEIVEKEIMLHIGIPCSLL